MKKLLGLWDSFVNVIQPAGEWVAILPVRLLMAYEFGKAGFGKAGVEGVPNWFVGVQEKFLFPFNVIPVEISWFLATWTEIIGGICLFFGLFTRFWAFSLIILTFVAMFGVHWPAEWSSLSELWEGYRVSRDGDSGNFRIPLLFAAMLFPLFFAGGGKLSLDHVVFGKLRNRL
ncbi:MAG: DoxX family protein [Woeseiaceae bacterium]